jgi:hypothetical protein
LKKISETLSTLQFTVLNLTVIAFWFLWGLWLAGSERYVKAFEGMNATVAREWLFTSQGNSSLLKFWFVGLCLIMACLGVNLFFCTWNKIFRIIKVRFEGPKFYMLIVHAFFGVVALGHFGGLMLGFEYGRIKLYQGEEHGIPEGYRVQVENVHFVDDPKVLRMSRREITKKDFHYRENYAEILLSRDGETLFKGRIGILHPLKYKDIQVTLMNFIPPGRHRAVEGGRGEPGIVITLSRNPVLAFFLIVYPLMIIGIFIHLLITWRPAARKAGSAPQKKPGMLEYGNGGGMVKKKKRSLL